MLLVNPPIYDFAAYDYWLRPLGMLSAAGQLRGKAEFKLFDFLKHKHSKQNPFGTGKFTSRKTPKPDVFANIPRHYHRYGVGKDAFVDFLKQNGEFDFVMIQTVMTYWYLGYKEVIDTVRQIRPRAKIILGGPYAIICAEHAKTIGADFVVDSVRLEKLFEYVGIDGDSNQFPLWEVYDKPNTAAMRISTGCPFKCSYCSVPKIYGGFKTLGTENKINEIQWLADLGVKNIAFYDDALLYKSNEALEPLLNEIIKRNLGLNFHSPNALNARFITARLAELMVKAGFKTFCLGFESSNEKFHSQTGDKVSSEELAEAVRILVMAGAEKKDIIAYQILGHPSDNVLQTEESMKFIGRLGIKIMLADFSPIPTTPDGEYCRKFVDLDEPLMHNKTAFPIILWGNSSVNRLKDLCREINSKVAI